MSLEQAREVMMKAHEGQKRWDEKPFNTHPTKVVQILEDMSIGDLNILKAAYLHDVLEDTNYSATEIGKKFGDSVLALVYELTFKSGNDQFYLNQVKRLSYNAKLIKMADIIANVGDAGGKSTHFLQKRMKALEIILNEVIK